MIIMPQNNKICHPIRPELKIKISVGKKTKTERSSFLTLLGSGHQKPA
jgi:hypothetical protein